MSGAPGLLCVHAHPDDEALWTGGVLARCAARGGRAAVVTCTAGERAADHQAGVAGQGDPGGPRLGGRRPLAEVRAAELASALELLGAGPPRLLGYRDSGMPADSDPGSFWRADLDEAVGRLVGHLRDFRPDVLVAYDAFGLYGHPDHVQAHRVALLAAEASGIAALYPQAGPAWRVPRLYLVTLPRSLVELARRQLAGLGLLAGMRLPAAARLSIGTPDELVTTAVDVRPWLERRWAAIRAHASQLGPGSPLDRLPAPLREALLGTEWFVRHRDSPRRPPAGHEQDLLGGLPDRAGRR
jgi:N-acetyl-1-D-myo-inositol-2-amino-2-deoxy-alpha-D-glucopyranoside deacetylase